MAKGFYVVNQKITTAETYNSLFIIIYQKNGKIAMAKIINLFIDLLNNETIHLFFNMIRFQRKSF